MSAELGEIGCSHRREGRSVGGGSPSRQRNGRRRNGRLAGCRNVRRREGDGISSGSDGIDALCGIDHGRSAATPRKRDLARSAVRLDCVNEPEQHRPKERRDDRTIVRVNTSGPPLRRTRASSAAVLRKAFPASRSSLRRSDRPVSRPSEFPALSPGSVCRMRCPGEF